MRHLWVLYGKMARKDLYNLLPPINVRNFLIIEKAKHLNPTVIIK